MPLVKAVCTNCNGILDVDNAKDAAICSYCGTPYIVEKAIQQFNVQNTNYIQNAVIVDTTNSEDELLKRGITQLKLNVWGDASDTFLNMSKLYPGNYKSWLGLCIVTANDYKIDNKEEVYRKNAVKMCPDSNKEDLLSANVYSDSRIKKLKSTIKDIEENIKFNDEQLKTVSRNIQILKNYRITMSIGYTAGIIIFIVGVILMFVLKWAGVPLTILCAIIGFGIIWKATIPPKNVPKNICSFTEIDNEMSNQNSKLENYREDNVKNNEKIEKIKIRIKENEQFKKTPYFINILNS